MVCVSFYVICIVELLVSSVICRFQGLSYLHVPECIEFSFILFIRHNIQFYFELCTYCNILEIYLSWNMNSVRYLFYMELLNYLLCDMLGGILECYELTHVLPYPDPTRQSCMSGQALLPHWLCNQKHPWGICSCSPIVNFLKVTFYHGMVTLVIFLMLFTVTCWKFQKIQQPYIKRYFYVFFSTNIVEILLKLRADASRGSGAVKAFLQGSSSPSPSPSPSSSSSLLFSLFA